MGTGSGVGGDTGVSVGRLEPMESAPCARPYFRPIQWSANYLYSAAILSCAIVLHEPSCFLRLWSTLDVEGWVTDDGLPKGWRIRSKDRLKDNWQFYFLSPQMETFKSNKAVLDYIR